jgi:hypothetical protein
MKIFIWKLFLEIAMTAIYVICIYYLWNWLMPEIMMAREITLLQAWGFRALAQFLTYNFSSEKKKNESNI